MLMLLIHSDCLYSCFQHLSENGLSPGETFGVGVLLEPIQDLYGLAFKIRFDDRYLRYASTPVFYGQCPVYITDSKSDNPEFPINEIEFSILFDQSHCYQNRLFGFLMKADSFGNQQLEADFTVLEFLDIRAIKQDGDSL